MKLASAADVLARMNLSNTVSAQGAATVDSALEAATNVLESILRTPLATTSRVDYFDFKLGRFDTFVPFSLYLTQGYLTGTPTVYVSRDGGMIEDLGDALVLSPTQYTLDKRTGKLTVLSEVNQGYSVIAVSYEAGFDEGSDEIPGYIKEAAISAAVFITNSQTITVGKKKDTASSYRSSVASVVSLILSPYIITPFNGIGPSRSVVAA